MKFIAFASLLAISLAGCSGNKSAAKTEAVAAQAPQMIEELTNQTTIYTCPDCGMEFDGPGKCNMCKVDLVQTKVAYICPADGKPVERTGKCPRCAVNAKVVKTAMTPASQGAPSGN